MIPTRVLGLLQSLEIDQKPDKKFRQGLIGTHTAVEGDSKNTCLLPEAGRRSDSLCGVRVGLCLGVGPEGFAHPFGGVECRGNGQSLLLLPTSCFCSSFFIRSIWVFSVFLYLIVHKLPQLHIHAVIFKPLQILCILLLGNICQVQILQQSVSGHRSQPVLSIQAILAMDMCNQAHILLTRLLLVTGNIYFSSWF